MSSGSINAVRGVHDLKHDRLDLALVEIYEGVLDVSSVEIPVIELFYGKYVCGHECLPRPSHYVSE